MDLQKELDRCAKCGQCRSVCPVFLALKDETLVARGRLAIIQAGQTDQQTNRPTDQFRKILDTCLMCRRCEENCSSLVDTSAVFKSERQRIADEKGLPLLLRFGFRWVLPNRWIYNSVMRLTSMVSRLFSHGSAPVRHLPLYFANLFQRMPRLASRSALEIYKGIDQRTTHDAQRITLFIGCAANYIYPEIIEALVFVLDRLKIPYVIPHGQVCCGMPALLSGDIKTAEKLSRINQKIFNAETIITVCPTCNRMLAEEYNLKGIKVMDAMEFLDAHNLKPVTCNLKPSTVYHLPCHSAGTKTPEIIKAFLKANTDYQEIDDVCCGGGGLFTFKYPELSDIIGKVRMSSLTNVPITQSPNPPITQLVTNCPGCMMQLEYLLSSNKHGGKVRHILNLIMDVYKTGQPVPHTHK